MKIKPGFIFEQAEYSLKSDSVNITKKGVVITGTLGGIDYGKKLPPLFVGQDEQIPFFNDLWDHTRSGSKSYKELQHLIKNSENLVELWREIEPSYIDWWKMVLLDTNSKIILKIEQENSNHKNPLVVTIEDELHILGLINHAYRLNHVMPKMVYDIITQNKIEKIINLIEGFSVPSYALKIAQFYKDELPEKFNNKLLAKCL